MVITVRIMTTRTAMSDDMAPVEPLVTSGYLVVTTFIESRCMGVLA